LWRADLGSVMLPPPDMGGLRSPGGSCLNDGRVINGRTWLTAASAKAIRMWRIIRDQTTRAARSCAAANPYKCSVNPRMMCTSVDHQPTSSRSIVWCHCWLVPRANLHKGLLARSCPISCRLAAVMFQSRQRCAFWCTRLAPYLSAQRHPLPRGLVLHVRQWLAIVQRCTP
jgi:hypothetical protein